MKLHQAECFNKREQVENGFCALAKVTDLVTGEKVFNHAATMRTIGQPCGPEGKLFEAKCPPHPHPTRSP